MKAKLLFTALLVLLALPALCQKEEDSLAHYAYLEKGEPFPFDSGVAISYVQYQVLFRNSLIERILTGTKEVLQPVPRTVYVEKEVRKKGDGNKVAWGLGGVGLGTFITALAFALTK